MIIKGKKMENSLQIGTILIICTLLFFGLYQFNLQSNKMESSEITFAAVEESGPILLTGGSVVTTPEGIEEYHLHLQWNGEGYLYLPRTNSLQINGLTPTEESSYRGSIYLIYSQGKAAENFDIIISASHKKLSSLDTYVYLGTYAQISDFINTTIICNYFILGLCVTAALFAILLYVWKSSENYLVWLAFLSLCSASYYGLNHILSFFSFLPGISMLLDFNLYQLIWQITVACLQYKIMQYWMSVKLGNHPFIIYCLIAALPAALCYQEAYLFNVFFGIFYFVLYSCYLLCFLRLKDSMTFEYITFLISWMLTSTCRLFELLYEIGILPKGDLNTRFRLRGMISCFYIVSFFIVTCKKFAQKYKEADRLNAHLEEEIAKKSRDQTLFVRSMLHNLKTPLFSLTGYCDMAVKTIDTNPQLALKYMEKTQEKAIYVGEMMDRIFLVTQMESGLIQFQRIPVNLTDIVHSSIESVQMRNNKKQFVWICELPDVMSVLGDPLYLQQVFQNILDNACIHTPSGETVAISAEITGKDTNINSSYGLGVGYLIHIRDTGCGIESSEIERIFDAYYSNRHGETNSSGLGLYISREIILRHQGRLTVESVPGKGSDFIIYLPAHPDAEGSDRI